MPLELTIDGHSVQRPRARAERTGAEAVELVRWARFLDQGDSTSAFNVSAVDALLEAADGDADLLHAAWTHALRAQRAGEATRSAVELVHSALELAS
jgi:hypothetical protein